MTGPFGLRLIIAHLIKAADSVEQQAKSVLGDGVVVQTDTGGDGDCGGVEASGQDVVWTGSEGLDPFQVLQALGCIFQIVGAVGPGYEDVGVDVFLGDGGFDIIGVKRGGESL